MNYLIQIFRNGESILREYHDDKPSEDYLRELVRVHEADFADVCRHEEELV